MLIFHKYKYVSSFKVGIASTIPSFVKNKKSKINVKYLVVGKNQQDKGLERNFGTSPTRLWKMYA